VEAIADIAKVESAPKMEGKTMMAIVSPMMHKKKPVGASEKPQAAAAPPAQKQEG
jgi:hypothetical protein